jgi:hypothetical protein
LEGDEAAVNATFEAIKKDQRHKDVILLEKVPISERLFPYWSMGFEKLEAKEFSGIEDFDNFLEKDLTPAGFATHKHVLGPLLAHLHRKLVNQVTFESVEQPPTQHEELPVKHEDPFIQFLHRTIRLGAPVSGFADGDLYFVWHY